MERKDVLTYENLIVYTKNNLSELPFSRKCWESAVNVCEKNKLLLEEDDTKKLNINPIKQYFKMRNLKMFKTSEEDVKESCLDEISSDEIGLDEDDFIVSWISLCKKTSERNYIKLRYKSYIDTYEINDGADKILLKRILSIELELYRLDSKRASGNKIDISEETKLSQQLNSILESLKWTKKQRTLQEEFSENRFTPMMDKLVKLGMFEPPIREYPKDEIDYLYDIIVKSQREMLT